MEHGDELEGCGPFGLPRQVPLSLRWEGHALAAKFGAGFGAHDRLARTMASAACALYSEHNGRGGWVSYSRTESHYTSVPKRYRSRLYTFALVPSAMDLLASGGLIDHDKAPPRRRGWQSAARMTEAGSEVMRAAFADRDRPRLARLDQPIMVRAKDGSLIDFTPTRESARMHRELDAVNEAIAGTDVSGCQSAPLVRIFNLMGPCRAADYFTRGGRAYGMGGWQSLPKEMRLQLQIGGEPVVEIDFDALHPSLLYEEVGHEKPAECYEIAGWERSLVKFAFLVLINADSGSARGAIAHCPAMLALLRAASVQPTESAAWDAAGRLIRDIERIHAPIVPMFNSDAGARLMRKDSDIAAAVMADMIGRGVLVLPVHDSFLVQASKADLLEEAMMRAARSHGLTDPKVKRFARRA